MDNKQIILTDNQAKSVEFSKNFREDYLNVVNNPVLLAEPILTTNLLFQIMLDLKNNMFHTDDSYLHQPSDKRNNQYKMELWENDFINTDKNEIKKRYRTSQFLKNRNKKLMTRSLDFLKNYKNEIYSFKNSKGKGLTTSGGLIKDWYFDDKTGVFEITISLYWADKIVRLEKGRWNTLRHDIIRDFKDTKQRFFILWLMDVKKYSGTTKNYKKILDSYQLKYPNVYELMRGFIEPIKLKLDNKHLNDEWISFNYFIDEQNKNNIKFVPYDVKPEKKLSLSKGTQQEIKKAERQTLKKAINYKAKYIKRRHSLSLKTAQKLRRFYLEKDLQLFLIKYKLFLKEIKKENKTALDYMDIQFVERLEEIYQL